MSARAGPIPARATRARRATILSTAKEAIHGLRGPVWSAIAPSTGDNIAMMKPEAAMP